MPKVLTNIIICYNHKTNKFIWLAWLAQFQFLVNDTETSSDCIAKNRKSFKIVPFNLKLGCSGNARIRSLTLAVCVKCTKDWFDKLFSDKRTNKIVTGITTGRKLTL